MSFAVKTVSLTRAIRRMAEGAHRPPLAEADDGEQYVLKLGHQDRDFPACELVGSLLARATGEDTPDIALVEIPAAVRAALSSLGDDWSDLASDCPGGRCFGSHYVGPACQRWSPSLASATDDLPSAAVRLLVLDLLIENADRQAGPNPNALLVGRRLVAIDHGQALPSGQGVNSGLSLDPAAHVAWSLVEPHRRMLAGCANRLPGDAMLRASVDAIPAAWWADPQRRAYAFTGLVRRRDTVRDTLKELSAR